MDRPIVRSIFAIAAGFIVTAVLVSVTDMVMAAVVPDLFPDVMAGAEPTTAGMVLNIGYGFVFAIVGGYVTATLAPRDVMRHIYVLLGLTVVFFGSSIMMYADIGFPMWYWLLLILAGLIGYYLGGKFYLQREGQAGEVAA